MVIIKPNEPFMYMHARKSKTVKCSCMYVCAQCCSLSFLLVLCIPISKNKILENTVKFYTAVFVLI